MMELCFATNNSHKLSEAKKILGPDFKILSLQDINCHDELPEEQSTLEGNSKQKAEYIWNKYKISCFADDTGLEVHDLNNEPGVFSARYAGPQRKDADNVALLLNNLKNSTDRIAQFRTSVSLILNGECHQFEGIIKGRISENTRGANGFGYDPVFIPDGFDKTFAEMTEDEKNSISHRALAMQQLELFLKSYY